MTVLASWTVPSATIVDAEASGHHSTVIASSSSPLPVVGHRRVRPWARKTPLSSSQKPGEWWNAIEQRPRRRRQPDLLGQLPRRARLGLLAVDVELPGRQLEQPVVDARRGTGAPGRTRSSSSTATTDTRAGVVDRCPA